MYCHLRFDSCSVMLSMALFFIKSFMAFSNPSGESVFCLNLSKVFIPFSVLFHIASNRADDKMSYWNKCAIDTDN